MSLSLKCVNFHYSLLRLSFLMMWLLVSYLLFSLRVGDLFSGAWMWCWCDGRDAEVMASLAGWLYLWRTEKIYK